MSALKAPGDFSGPLFRPAISGGRTSLCTRARRAARAMAFAGVGRRIFIGGAPDITWPRPTPTGSQCVAEECHDKPAITGKSFRYLKQPTYMSGADRPL